MPEYAIAGLGVTPQGVIAGTSAERLAWDAVELALADAGLDRAQVNGYIYQPGFGEGTSGKAASRAALGAHSTLQINSSGASGIFAIATAIGLIEAGTAEYVMCVHATNARSQTLTIGAGEENENAVFGLFSPGAQSALMAQSYFHKYATSSADLAEIAVALRANAVPREDAYMFNRPITVDDHQDSRFIVRPLHLLDYCLVTDGAIAFIVTTSKQVLEALNRNRRFVMTTYPRRIGSPRFSGYEPGMAYGEHVDIAIMVANPPLRSDIAMTLFLSDPTSYDGGELMIQTSGAETAVKLPAGSLVCYPPYFLHRVAPVTRRAN